MVEKELISWLKLTNISRLKNKSVLRILESYQIQDLENFDDADFLALGLNSKQIASWRNPDLQLIEKCLQWAEKENQYIIYPSHKKYPYLLKQISDFPKILYIRGNLDLLSTPQIAIVGSRHASYKGLSFAWQFANDLVEYGITITSGMALGVDGRAHKGALEAGGKTIAVLGSGLDVIYPKAHIDLSSKICMNGTMISEFFPWSPPKPEFFPKRNRIISGLSLGVLVVEAALRSGSLITARLALDQGREVFALPSAPDNIHGRGSNGLIKQGAFLVETVQDILTQVTTLANCAIKNKISDESPSVSEQKLPFPELLANVGYEAISVDVLAEACKQPVNVIMTQLLELELQGFVAVVPGGYVRTRRS